MKITLSILTITIFLSVPFVSANVILEGNGDTTVSGNMEVQGTFTGPDIQKPLSGNCPAGSSIREISPAGSVVCETDNDSGGDITEVEAGTGLTGGGQSANVKLEVDTTYIQRRVSTSCAAGKSISAIKGDGSIVCESEIDPEVGRNTTGYVPTWDGSSLVAGSIFDDGTNVGVGTSSPAEKLTVDGTIETSGGVKFADGVVQTAASSPSWHQILPVEERFVLVMNNEAVLDKETGLVWELSPSTSIKNWLYAVNHCNDRIVANRKGWHLPTIEQFGSLVDITQSNPALPNGHPFDTDCESGGCVQSLGYWTSSTLVVESPPNSNGAWVQYISHGGAGSLAKSYELLVWCVRGGQSHDSMYFY